MGSSRGSNAFCLLLHHPLESCRIHPSVVNAQSPAPCLHPSAWEGERESCFFKTMTLKFHTSLLPASHWAQFSLVVTPALKGG